MKMGSKIVLNKNDRFPINYAHVCQVCQFTNKIDDNYN